MLYLYEHYSMLFRKVNKVQVNSKASIAHFEHIFHIAYKEVFIPHND